jgi:5-(carboxyamino)imidazole ribonucleotide mutase
MEILEYYEYHKSKKIIYITVAGLSNALSGVVSANVTQPVIACPPFADKADYQVNIHSTLQMPSGVPSACILRPDNVASFCKRLLAL